MFQDLKEDDEAKTLVSYSKNPIVQFIRAVRNVSKNKGGQVDSPGVYRISLLVFMSQRY